LTAAEEYEYTPYGVPTVRSNEGGQAVLRVWDEAAEAVAEGGVLVANPREGRAAGAYLCAADSPAGATDASGRVAESAAQSSIGLRFLYTGRPWSPVGEVYHYRARWYAPECGRFISRDPIGYAAGPTQYGYVGGNPVMRVDPTGLKVTITSHVVALDAHHAAVEIRPDDPCDFTDSEHNMDPRFKKDKKGWFLTLSAGPVDDKLVSDINRASDDPTKNDWRSAVQPPAGMSDTDFIKALLDADSNYKDNLTYEATYQDPGEYNSNGYVSGIIGAVGGIISQPGRLPSVPPTKLGRVPYFPNFNNPVPPQNFRPQQSATQEPTSVPDGGS
jgi:RHS repeat-associated protein